MSCGTRAQDSRPGDPDGAWLLHSSLWDQSLPNLPERAPAADAFTGILLTDCAAARQSISARPYCLSGLREKTYPPNRRMSTPATTDFSVSGGKVICSESRVRQPAPRPPQPPGNRPGSRQTQGNERSARPRTSSRARASTDPVRGSSVVAAPVRGRTWPYVKKPTV